jgi:hypothetical protein
MNNTDILKSLPIGCLLDLKRCILHYNKFNGNKCTKLNSAKSLVKRGLIIKNHKRHYIPTKIGLQYENSMPKM